VEIQTAPLPRFGLSCTLAVTGSKLCRSFGVRTTQIFTVSTVLDTTMRRDESKASFAIIRYNFRTYESGGVMAVIKGRAKAEMKIEHFEDGQSKEDRNAGWRYFLERTDLKSGMDPEKATKLRQARLDIRESGF
jgi:hypothetical protein